MSVRTMGRLIQPVASPTTTATRFSFRNAHSVAILAVGASGTQNVTVSVAKDASGTGEVTFDGAAGHGDGITEYFSYAGSTGLWTRTTQSVAGTFPTTSGTGDMAMVEIDAGALPDAYAYIKASHANAQLVFIFGPLAHGRRVTNLFNLTA